MSGDRDLSHLSGPKPTVLFVAAAFMLVGAAVLTYFTHDVILQAFRGPRPISPQEMAAVTAPAPYDKYVEYTPNGPAIDTGLQFGVKDNPGTKYVLLPVGDNLLFCSARIANNGPTYVGRIEYAAGDPEDEVLRRVRAGVPGAKERLMPAIMLQAVRSIWVDVVGALVGILGLTAAAVGMLLKGWTRKRMIEANE